ncbi:hypothetical protein BS17DRAFT_775874 [Gyrodon lividus]|nr:hypothetical protein BS17DRAFT_775874 [Gyrodon lividus]
MVRSRRVVDGYDTVEDSEPEREQRRQQRGEDLENDDYYQRFHRSPPSVSGNPPPNRELSLESDLPSDAKNIQKISLHATNAQCSREHEGLQMCANHDEPVADELEVNQIISPNIKLTRSICPSPPRIVTIESTIESFDVTSGSEKEDQLDLMQISRFAYQPPTSKHFFKPAISCQPATSSNSVSDPGPSRRIGPPKPKKVTNKRAPDEFADSQFIKLFKCIGCGLQWTSRKTARQKRLHIEQCAKKNSLTEDTVRILIQREIGVSTSSEGTSSKDGGIPGGSHNESRTDTLMDSVVSSEPVKKARWKQVVPTIRSLPETREGILDRARDILGPSARFEIDAPGAGLLSKGRAEVQSTQPFKRSLLACRNTGDPPNLWRSAVLGVNQPVEGSAPSQAFGVNALRGRKARARQMVEGCTEGSPFLQTQKFGASKLAQEFNSRNGEASLRKRSLSPPFLKSNDRVVRPRLVQ